LPFLSVLAQHFIMADSPPLVSQNSQAHRFEIREGDAVAFLQYADLPRARAIHLIHTEVPPSLQGRGYAGELARAALEYARQAHLRVIPSCPFVRSYIERHPEYADLADRTLERS
jgi:predicted GNAT family acetyltransferase